MKNVKEIWRKYEYIGRGTWKPVKFKLSLKELKDLNTSSIIYFSLFLQLEETVDANEIIVPQVLQFSSLV